MAAAAPMSALGAVAAALSAPPSEADLAAREEALYAAMLRQRHAEEAGPVDILSAALRRKRALTAVGAVAAAAVPAPAATAAATGAGTSLDSAEVKRSIRLLKARDRIRRMAAVTATLPDLARALAFAYEYAALHPPAGTSGGAPPVGGAGGSAGSSWDAMRIDYEALRAILHVVGARGGDQSGGGVAADAVSVTPDAIDVVTLDLPRIDSDLPGFAAAADVDAGGTPTAGSAPSLPAAFNVFAEVFPPLAVMRIPRDEAHTVSLRHLARYGAEKVHALTVWRRVALYDTEGDGYLREHDLENCIFETIASLPELGALQENFFPFYVFTAVRKFAFFLDQHHTGRIAIPELLSSRVFHEWLALYPPGHDDIGGAVPTSDAFPDAAAFRAFLLGTLPPHRDGGSASPAAAASADDWFAPIRLPIPTAETYDRVVAQLRAVRDVAVPPSNWFSAANTIRVYTHYLDLDIDQNGLLSPTELARAQNGTLTAAFLSRVFQEVRTYGGEIDYKSYLDFVLATELRTTHASMRYIFTMCDVRRLGRLELMELRHFMLDVARGMAAAGHDVADIGNICDEIFDMVHPAHPGYITLEDLIRSKVGHTVLHMITDVAGFWQYDNREFLLQQQQQAMQAAEISAGAGGGGGGPAASGGATTPTTPTEPRALAVPTADIDEALGEGGFFGGADGPLDSFGDGMHADGGGGSGGYRSHAETAAASASSADGADVWG